MRRRLLIVSLGVVVLLAGLTVVVALRDGQDEGGADAAPVEEVRGLLFGSVEDLAGGGAGGADVVVTVAGGDDQLGTAVTDELGLFEVDLGDHAGPVVIRATKQAKRAATVVAVSADGAATGVRLTLGEAGQGALDGRVLAGDRPATEPAVVEARFVETGRSTVTDLQPDGSFRIEGLPLDGDLILIATAAAGDQQGFAATAVSESLATNSADITFGSRLDAADANQVQEPDIVTDELDGWSTDGPVTVVPADEVGEADGQ